MTKKIIGHMGSHKRGGPPTDLERKKRDGIRSPHVPHDSLLYSGSKKQLFPEELIRILKHWKEVRSGEVLTEDEIHENLRCAQDLVEVLRVHGWIIDPELWKKI